MKTVDQTLEQLDNTLDRVDELLNELPLSNERKHQLTAMIYDLWMEVEHDMELRPADFS
jgi:ribosome assembly protein YihI (activator of Der GTPase)